MRSCLGFLAPKTFSFGAKPLYVLWTLYAFGVVMLYVSSVRDWLVQREAENKNNAA